MSHWKRLHAHCQRQKSTSIAQLFGDDPNRAERFSTRCGELLFDFSKTSIDAKVWSSLLTLAEGCKVMEKRDQMLSGQKINQTENRAVLHTALRCPNDRALLVDGINVMEEVHHTLNRMRVFSEGVRGGQIQTASGDKFTDVVNIGIGGSDLGPEMTSFALSNFHDGPEPHFISNIDGAQATECLAKLNPQTTLVIVASKTFTTIETMTNAVLTRNWMQSGAGKQSLRQQFAAVSSNVQKCIEFGLNPDQVFGFGDWVGGRYSIWGPIGLPLMIAIGSERFQKFLNGAHMMDRHFAEAVPEHNLPLQHGLVGIWLHQICGHRSRAILPYDYRLRRLPAYLQQLIMESNGKSVTLDGDDLMLDGATVIWGEPGTNGQHAFFQALHQGTQVVPCEFLVAAIGHEKDTQHHHDLLIANCLAQSEALMTGRGTVHAPSRQEAPASEGELSAHRQCPGNRPSITLAYPRLTPFMLGQILALYEHSVFVEGAILGLNSFDQWGVEFGKEMAETLLSSVAEKKTPDSASGSTQGLLDFIHTARQQSS